MHPLEYIVVLYYFVFVLVCTSICVYPSLAFFFWGCVCIDKCLSAWAVQQRVGVVPSCYCVRERRNVKVEEVLDHGPLYGDTHIFRVKFRIESGPHIIERHTITHREWAMKWGCRCGGGDKRRSRRRWLVSRSTVERKSNGIGMNEFDGVIEETSGK